MQSLLEHLQAACIVGYILHINTTYLFSSLEYMQNSACRSLVHGMVDMRW